ncbi:O-antigen ligase family protein [Arthrobacter rhombi]|uniref:O-antigen ligase family protein n=1 Tax=Arthrobacter rhombi TaxID=71253 RepID=UPI003FD218FA
MLSREDPLIRLSRVVFLGGLVAVSLLTLRISGSITLGDFLLVVSAGILLVASHRQCLPNPAPVATALGFLLVLSGGALSSVVADEGTASVLVLVRLLYVSTVLPWQARRLLNSTALLSKGLLFFGTGAAICGAGTLLQFVYGSEIIPGSQLTSSGRLSGFTGHVSDTGGITALAVILGVAGLRREAPRRHQLLSVVIAACGLLGLVLSGSVSGLLAAGIGVLVLVVLRAIPRHRLVMAGLAVAIAMYLATSLVGQTSNALTPIERIKQVFGVTSGSSTLNTSASRWETIRIGWSDFLHAPLTGVGLESSASPVVGDLGVHNLWVGSLHQGGILLGLGLIIIVVSYSWLGHRARRLGPTAPVVYATVIAALFFSMTAPSFFNRYFWIPIAFLSVHAALALKWQRSCRLAASAVALPPAARSTISRRQTS